MPDFLDKVKQGLGKGVTTVTVKFKELVARSTELCETFQLQKSGYHSEQR